MVEKLSVSALVQTAQCRGGDGARAVVRSQRLKQRVCVRTL